MGDEGVGVHAMRRLAEKGVPPGVTVVDGGTGGFHLLSYLTAGEPVILVDATLDGRPPGTVSLIEPRYPSDFPRSLGAHDIGLRDLVEAAALTGAFPRILLVTVSIASIESMVMTLSPRSRRHCRPSKRWSASWPAVWARPETCRLPSLRPAHNPPMPCARRERPGAREKRAWPSS
jgi:hydrogenase maturation protease